jgi:hypothetical protein
MDQVDTAPDMDVPILDLRTIVVDFDEDSLTVSDNGLWVPHDQDVAEGLTQMLGRTVSDLSSATRPDVGPVLRSAADDVDVELLLEREIAPEIPTVDGQAVDKMQRHTGIDPARSWGYGAGPPPEVDHVVELLEDADLDPADHLSRLVWGKKEPMDRVGRPVDELTGNYGVELQPRDYGLIAIDVDYPEEFPEEFELPETLEVSSPHGDDSRRHILLKCSDKGAIAEEIQAWAVQSTPWGDLWIGDRYVVGPGSQLSEYGCDDGEHIRGEAGGCEDCEDPESGVYRIVNDAPIADVDADTILDLLDSSPGYELRDGPADPDPPEPDEADVDDEETGTTCDNCGAEHEDEETLKELPVGGSARVICRGGCE